MQRALEELVEQIKAANRGAKLSRSIVPECGAMADAYLVVKSLLQIQLLRHPLRPAVLRVDPTMEGEVVYSVALRSRIGSWHDADHLPERVARLHLTPAELSALVVS